MNVDPGPSTPPETPEAFRRPRQESILPPRAWPSAACGFALSSAVAAATQIPDPLTRTITMAACSLLAWIVGYVTPPPRRRFRRSDERGRWNY